MSIPLTMSVVSLSLAANGLWLCEGRAIELQKFKYSTNDR